MLDSAKSRIFCPEKMSEAAAAGLHSLGNTAPVLRSDHAAAYGQGTTQGEANWGEQT